ncbi:hypothetical protein ABK040_008842 [Willaertia magna]
MLQIFSYLTPHELIFNIGLVCKSWYFLSIKTNFIWEYLYNKEFEDENCKPSTYEEELDEDKSFNGYWKQLYTYRMSIRNRWLENKPDRLGYLDMLETEYSKNKLKRNPNAGSSFSKDHHLACISEEELIKDDSNEKKLYRVDPQDRSDIVKLCLIGSDRLLSGDSRGVIKLFSLRTFQMLRKFVGGHSTSIKELLFISSEQLKEASSLREDGNMNTKFKLDLNHNYFLSTENYNAIINVWDLDNGLLVKKIRADKPIEFLNEIDKDDLKLRSPVTSIELIKTSFGLTLVVCSLSTIEFYDLITLALIKSINIFKKPKPTVSTTTKTTEAPPVPRQRTLFDEMEEEENANNEEEEEEVDDNNDDFNNTNVITGFTLLDENTIAVMTGKMMIYIYNVNISFCVKKIDLTKTKLLEVENYNRPLTPEAYCKVYNKFTTFERIVSTNLQKVKNNPNQLSVCITISPQDYMGQTKTFVKFIDYRLGIEVPTKSIKIDVGKKMYNYGYYNTGVNGKQLYMDEDKIVHASNNTVFISGRKDGTIKQELSQSLNVTYYVTALYSDERYLILGTNFGGIIVLDYGGQLFYWNDLKGRKVGETLDKMEEDNNQ